MDLTNLLTEKERAKYMPEEKLTYKLNERLIKLLDSRIPFYKFSLLSPWSSLKEILVGKLLSLEEIAERLFRGNLVSSIKEGRYEARDLVGKDIAVRRNMVFSFSFYRFIRYINKKGEIRYRIKGCFNQEF